MPPAIVYTDMEDPADGAGTVFAGKKFFVLQRVPSRSHYISLIESNGGRVVKFDTQADYLIADHIRKRDAPAGSFSYKLIDESISNGEMPDDPTPINSGNYSSPAHRGVVTASSSHKSTRTPFSADDDKMLYALMRDLESRGYAVKGHELYKRLAELNSRHTAQSWRERYVKNLSMKPPAGWQSFPADALGSLVKAVLTAPSSSSLPRAPFASDSQSASPVKSRTEFTEEDDQELIRWVGRAVRRNEAITGEKLYQNLEAHNPRHTAQSWRNRWIKTLSKRYVDSGPTPDDPARSAPPSTAFSRPRVMFDEEDDRLLTGWIRRAEAEGESISGNELYKKLALDNPWHSWHSWRDRWLRHLSIREQEEDEASFPPPSPPQRNCPAKPSTQIRPGFRVPPEDPAQSANSSSANQRLVRTPRVQAVTQMAGPHPPAPNHGVEARAAPRIALHDSSTQTHLDYPSCDDSTFTQGDFDDLLNVSLDIQNIVVGRYHEAWLAYEHLRPSHTAREWRSFYERRVLPVALQKEADPDFLNASRDDELSRFWQNQGQPIDVLPYEANSNDNIDPKTSSKRKSKESESTAAHDQASKRRRVDPEMSEPMTKDADVEPTGKNGSHLETNTLGRASADVEPARKNPKGLTIDNPIELRATAEPGNANEKDFEHDKPSPTFSHRTAEEEEQDAEDADEQIRREMAEQEEHRPQLTAHNLARSQKEHSSPKGQRGADLEEDHEDDDQDDFATVLASMLPAGAKEKILQSVEAAHDHDKENEKEDFEEEEEAPEQEEEEMEDEEEPAVFRHIDTQLLDPNLSPARAPVRELSPDAYHPMPWDLPDEDRDDHQPTARTDTDMQEAQKLQRLLSASLEPLDNPPTTQQIYTTATRPFTVDPSPPPTSPPPPPSDSQILTEDDFWPYIDAQEVRGFTEDTVIEALRSTSFNPKLATKVLDARGGRVVMAGVWSKEEDDIARGGDARAIRGLEGKHGKGAVERRCRWLDEWDEDQRAHEEGKV